MLSQHPRMLQKWRMCSMCWKVSDHTLQPGPVTMWLHVSGPLNKVLKGHRLGSDKDVMTVILEWFQQQPREFFTEGIHQLVCQWDAWLMGTIFNGLYYFAQNNSQMGFIWTSLIQLSEESYLSCSNGPWCQQEMPGQFSNVHLSTVGTFNLFHSCPNTLLVFCPVSPTLSWEHYPSSAIKYWIDMVHQYVQHGYELSDSNLLHV
jgi:hypothetical protein